MSYVDLNKLNEDNIAGKDLTAAAMKAGGYTHVRGMGDIPIQLNQNGFAIAPADKLPDGVLDKLKGAWADSGHNVNTFFNSEIDGKSVRSIFGEMPSQQAYAVPAKLDGFPRGTAMPSAEWHDEAGKTFTAIKYEGTNHLPTTPAPPVTPGPTPPAGPEHVGSVDGTYNHGWWKFFVDPKFLMGAAAIAGIIALLKALSNSIKVRFRKCAKVLYRMQKDFGGAEKGMDMRAVLPGVGSQIMDWIARRFGGKGKKFNDKKASGALGLRPFVDNYRNEIASDYQEARKAFNMISAAGKGIDEKKGMEQNSGAMDTQPEAQNSSYNVVYTSFTEAIKSEPLNESAGETLNESVAAIVAIGSLALRGGMFLYNKIGQDGKPEGEAKPVQVTPQSTREICYSIMNMFFSKYFNMKAVSEKLGMNVEALGDIDASNVDKFTKIAEAMKGEQAASSTSKMFTRVHKNYTAMLDHYKNIANGVVKNFDTYTRKKKREKGKDLGEKDSNLLLAANQKLQAEVERQIDGYENNFFRVANAIITSPEYTTFVDFIIKNVIPVFKSGLASDADYVLDIVPKIGEFYVVHQTNSQTSLEDGQTAEGNVALVRIEGFNKEGGNSKNPLVKFTKYARLTDGSIKRNDKNIYDLSTYPISNIDKTAYSKEVGQDANAETSAVELPYNKWMALDPVLATNVPGEEKPKVYKREVEVPVEQPNAENGEQNQEQQTNQTETKTEYLFVIPPVKETTEREYTEDTELNELFGKKKKEETGEDTSDATEQPAAETPAEQPAQEEKLPVKDVLFVSKKGEHIDINIQANDTTREQIDNIVKSEENNMKFVEVPEEEATELLQQLDAFKKDANKEAVQTAENIPDIVNKKEEENPEVDDNAITVEKIIENITNDNNLRTVSTAIANALTTVTGKISGAIQSAEQQQPADRKNPAAAIQSVLANTENFVQPAANGRYYYIGEGTVAIEGYNRKMLQFPLNQELKENVSLVLFIEVGIAHVNTNNTHGLEEFIRYSIGTSENGTYKFLGGINNEHRIGYNALVQKKTNEVANAILGYLKKVLEYCCKKYIKLQPAEQTQQGQSQPTEQPQQQAQPAQQPVTQPQSVSASFSVTYSDMFNLAESFMGTLSYLNVHRFIKPEQRTKEQYYVLSENAWGDGVTVNPVAKLNEFIKNTLATCETYDDFTRLSKSSVSINFMPVNEDCSYKTVLPYNRYQMLTEANPLYEATVILSFDQFGAVSNIIDKGVTKICK